MSIECVLFVGSGALDEKNRLKTQEYFYDIALRSDAVAKKP